MNRRTRSKNPKMDVESTVLNIKINDDDEIEIIADCDEEGVLGNREVTNYVVRNIKGEGDDDCISIVQNNKSSAVEIIDEEDIQNMEDIEDQYEENRQLKEIVEHVCAKCSNVFSSVKALQRHLAYCRYTSDAGNRIAEMYKHIDMIERESETMEKQNICFCCEENFNTCHAGHINCSHCPKSFKSQLSLERHLFILHSSTEGFQCEVCSATCPSAKILEMHVSQHFTRGKPFACKKCGKEFTRQYHVIRHQKYSSCSDIDTRGIDCHVCGKSFNRLDNLRGHLRQHVGKDPIKKPEYNCPYCEKIFVSTSILNIHIRTHTGERPFPCDLCEKTFPSNVALKKHRRYHTGERPYACQMCSQAFAAKEVLNRHMKRHTGERPHSCDECGKSFIQATQLKCHLKVHMKSNVCEICSDAFRTLKQLEKHILRVHKPSGKNRTTISTQEFECSFCKKIFVSENGYNRHMKMELKKHNIFKCDICGARFTNKQCVEFHRLKEHDNIETEIERVCTICSQSFQNHQELLRHFKVQHRQHLTEVLDKKHESDKGVVIALETDDNENENADGVMFEEYVIEEYQEDVKNPELVNSTDVSNKNGRNSTQRRESIEMDDDMEMILPNDVDTSEVEEDEADIKSEVFLIMDSETLTKNVTELINLLVDSATLEKFGWPTTSVENILRKVIDDCGHPTEDLDMGTDYETRMREYVKLLFSVVVDNGSIRELLNNHPIDEVIYQVLSMAGGD